MRRILFFVIIGFLFLARPAYSFSPRAIRAKACVILGADDTILFSKNASTKLPPASTVKLMTAMVALDSLDPAAVVTVSSTAARTRSGRPRLKAGDQVTVSDLLHLALMKSSNAAAVALAEATSQTEEYFVVVMNRKAQEIGANDTDFRNASGLPGTEQHTTALNLTTILKKALTYPLIREIIGKKTAVITTVQGRKLSFGNTDALLWYRDDMVGGKTGFTNTAQHCFVGAIETEKGLVYAAVLGAPSRRKLWKSTSVLVNLTSEPDFVPSVETAEERQATKTRKRKSSRSL